MRSQICFTSYTRLLLRCSMAAILVCFCLPISSQASSFKVHPLRFDFSDDTRTAVFKLNNTTDHDVTVQLSTASWTQDAFGKDIYDPTADIVFFPRIMKIARGEERIVRIGYKGQPEVDREKTYRLFAQELPQRGQKEGTLNFAFRFSVPVFVPPQRKQKAVEKLMKTELDNGQLKVWMQNTGGQHYSVKRLDARGVDTATKITFTRDTGGWYVLAKSQRSFVITLDEATCKQSSYVEVEIDLGRRKLVSRTPVDATQCIAVKEKPGQVAVQ